MIEFFYYRTGLSHPSVKHRLLKVRAVWEILLLFDDLGILPAVSGVYRGAHHSPQSIFSAHPQILCHLS